jgi:hypothetical protein
VGGFGAAGGMDSQALSCSGASSIFVSYSTLVLSEGKNTVRFQMFVSYSTFCS